MYRHVDDFLEQYRNLAEGTSRVLDALTDASLDQEVEEGHRSIRRLAWHIVITVPEMMNRTGLGLSSVDQHAAPPETATQIRQAYGAVSSELVGAVTANWSDETLLETDDMYGEQWHRAFTVLPDTLLLNLSVEPANAGFLIGRERLRPLGRSVHALLLQPHDAVVHLLQLLRGAAQDLCVSSHR